MEIARIQKLNERIKTLIEFDNAAAIIDGECIKATQHGFLYLGTELLEATLHDPPLIYNYPESKGYPPRWDKIFTTLHYIFGFSIKIKDENVEELLLEELDLKEDENRDPNLKMKIFLLFYGLLSIYGIYEYFIN